MQQPVILCQDAKNCHFIDRLTGDEFATGAALGVAAGLEVGVSEGVEAAGAEDAGGGLEEETFPAAGACWGGEEDEAAAGAGVGDGEGDDCATG